MKRLFFVLLSRLATIIFISCFSKLHRNLSLLTVSFLLTCSLQIRLSIIVPVNQDTHPTPTPVASQLLLPRVSCTLLGHLSWAHYLLGVLGVPNMPGATS